MKILHLEVRSMHRKVRISRKPRRLSVLDRHGPMHYNSPLHHEHVAGAGWNQSLLDFHVGQRSQLCIVKNMVPFRRCQVGKVALGVHRKLRIGQCDDDLVNMTRLDYGTPARKLPTTKRCYDTQQPPNQPTTVTTECSTPTSVYKCYRLLASLTCAIPLVILLLALPLLLLRQPLLLPLLQPL